MIDLWQQASGVVLAVSAKAYAGLVLFGLALSDVSNPVIALGGIAAALLAIAALWGKAMRRFTVGIETQLRQAKMLAQFEGSDERPGVMDEIKSLHVGQADILLAVADLKRHAVRHRDEDPIL